MLCYVMCYWYGFLTLNCVTNACVAPDNVPHHVALCAVVSCGVVWRNTFRRSAV